MRMVAFQHNRWFLSVAVLVTALLLKYHYSNGTSEQLVWILRPLAILVSLLTGLHFEFERGLGWVNLAESIAIAPACAGVNFLILIFCLGSYQLLWTSGRKARLSSIFLLLVAAYGFTILVNGLRIMLSISPFEQEVLGAIINPETAHRLSGVVIYYNALIIYYISVSCVLNGRKSNRGSSLLYLLVPLLWYLGYALVLPLVNSVNTSLSIKFWAHAQVVILVSSTLTLSLTALFWLYQKVKQGRSPEERGIYGQCNSGSRG
ncbi:MAG: exosortase K [Desulfobulbaceae bacterium]|nr:MAG: exosortase K [Desulfobulbaceae bacterium]